MLKKYTVKTLQTEVSAECRNIEREVQLMKKEVQTVAILGRKFSRNESKGVHRLLPNMYSQLEGSIVVLQLTPRDLQHTW